MLGYEEIRKFVKHIYYANSKVLDEDYLAMWVREISNTGVDITDIRQAETEIIRNNIPLKIYDVCKVLKKNKESKMIPITTEKCRYCGGRGYVYLNLYFDTNGKLISDNYALACVCNTNPITTQMCINDDNNRTEGKRGYFRCFNTYMERENYIKQVKRNGGMDIKRF